MKILSDFPSWNLQPQLRVFQLLLKAGGEGKHTVFLFADSQIKDEAFMEDISMILNTGDVPNLYAADEKAEIIEKMQGMARKEVFLITVFVIVCLSSTRPQAAAISRRR